MLAVLYSVNRLHKNYKTKRFSSWGNHSDYILPSASNISYEEEENFGIAGEDNAEFHNAQMLKNNSNYFLGYSFIRPLDSSIALQGNMSPWIPGIHKMLLKWRISMYPRTL